MSIENDSLIEAIGAIASAAEIGRAARKKSKSRRRKYLKSLDVKQIVQNGESQFDGSESVSAYVMRVRKVVHSKGNDPAFEALEERVRLAREAAALKISSGADIPTTTRELVAAVCEILWNMMSISRQRLPERLHEIWEDYHCPRRYSGPLPLKKV